MSTRFNEDGLLNRARAAWFREAYQKCYRAEQPSDVLSGIEDVDGRVYVVLRNSDRMLKVYRLTNHGLLKGLRRPPRGLVEEKRYADAA